MALWWTISTVVFGSPEWTLVMIGVLVVFALVTTLSAIASRKGTLGWRLSLAALKIVAVALLGICLLDPQWTTQRFKTGENIVALLGDGSVSMTVRDTPRAKQSRGEVIKAELADVESAWQTRLSQDFDVRRYIYDATLSSVDSFGEMDFFGPASNLHTALGTLKNRYRLDASEEAGRQPLAAVLLFSDGNVTDSTELSEEFSGVPVYPVVASVGQSMGDLSVSNIAVTETNFEDAPITIQAEVRRTGDVNDPVTVTLSPVDESSQAETQTQELTLESEETKTVRFEVKPVRTGPVFYRLRVHASGEEEIFERPESSREATTVNNEKFVVVNRDSQIHRLLYVAGRPNWEHKFLGRALEEDRLLHLVSLVRIARKEAKFDFRGRVGDDNNSLFRGFNDGADDGTENFDEPVLIRLNTRDELELSNGFPQSKADLYGYDAVILDDVEAAFLSRDQMSLLDRFVSERGGGLIMLGGLESFHHGGWDETPIGDALPVYIDRSGDPSMEEMLGWELTREGWLEEWMRLRETEGPERRRISEMPAFGIASEISGVKPGARILAALNDGSGQVVPALVTQQYGRGRTSALVLGDFWKWSLKQEDETNREDSAKFWRQFLRWLVGDVPQRVEVATESFTLAGVPATQFRVTVRDKEFEPLEGIGVQVRVQPPEGDLIELDAQPSLEEAGLFEAVHVSRDKGMYTATVTAPGDETTPGEEITVGWVSDPSAQEFERTSVDRESLEQLAKRTGGEVVALDKLEEFVASLPTRELPVMETESHPLWHQPTILVVVILLLAGEWGLRRMRGMA